MIKLFHFSKFVKLLLIVLTISCCQVFAADVQAKDSDCYPANKIAAYDSSDCTLCPIFRVVFNTISKIAAKASKEFSQPVKYVSIVAFAIWLAIYLLQYLVSTETRDIKDAFQEILTKGAQIVLVVVILDTGATQFYKWLINPVYETAIDGSTIAYNSGLGATTTRINLSAVPKVEEISSGLPSSMGNKIVESMVAMENNVSEIRAFGSSLICYSWERRVIIFPRLRFLLSGLFFWVMAMAILFIVPLLLVDVVFQLGVAVALLAPAIGSYPFRPTRQYAKKVWETFLNSAFAFLFTAIIVVIISSALKTTAETMTAGTGFTWEQIMSDRTGLMDKYADQFGWFQGRMLKFVFIFVLAWAVLDMGRQFADEFASSISSTKIGGSIGTMAASSAKGMATRMGKPLLNYADDKVKQGFSNLGQWGRRRKANKVMAREDKKFDKKLEKGEAVRNSDGSVSYTKQRFLRGNVTYTRDAEGNISKSVKRSKMATYTEALSNRVLNKFRRPENQVIGASDIRFERISSGDYVTTRKVRLQTMADGSTREIIIGEKVQALNRNAESLMNGKCGIDVDKIADMTAGVSGEKLKILQEQIARRIYSENMNDTHKGKYMSQQFISDGKGNITIISKDTRGGLTKVQMRIPCLDQGTKDNARVYNAQDLQKLMQTYDQQKDDPQKLNEANNTMGLGKESIQAFVNGDIQLSSDAKALMQDFVTKFADGKENENLRNLALSKLNRLNNDRFEISTEYVSRKGKVTKTATDGIYNRVDTYRIFDEDKTALQRFGHNLHRAPIIIGYGARRKDRNEHDEIINSLYNNSITMAENNVRISNTDIGDRETIDRIKAENDTLDTIQKYARKDKHGRIISNSSWAKTGSYTTLQSEENVDLEALTTVLPKGETVRKTFNFTTGSGREYGVRGFIQEDGKFVDADGNLIADYKRDEHGNRIYMDAFGKQFAGKYDEDGVLRRVNGYDEEGNAILERDRRAFLGIIGKKKSVASREISTVREVMTMKLEDGKTRDIFIKDGIISDVYGGRVYGHTEQRNKYDEAKMAEYFKDTSLS